MALIRVAGAAAHFGRDLERSIERIGMVVLAARKVGVSLLVLPDAALGGHPGAPAGLDPAALPSMLTPNSPEVERVRAMVGDMVVCVGYSEAVDDRRYHAALCLTGDGVLGHYRQVHRSPTVAAIYSDGERLAAFDTPVGRLGMLIDYDKTFPEAARSLALDGARIIACLCAWPASLTQRAPRLTQDRQSRLFDLYDCTRAAENQVLWISANQTGATGGLRFLGQAKVVGPGGEVLARTWGKAGLALAELDVDGEIDRARLAAPLLQQRRPDLYLEK
ncbi:MAG TPA: carbon-nitrogen hydrolase family protein [Jatrophihabitans sp.]|jgi:predicted amidohydrolase|uniref:carbon-nitrogen hydrolase family protein n=1 Tax=Jatrophihabitans sp. TaxID=1932789 RepID=UPI002DF786DA|nr:carbon-nitrogen hydrolase family protein [Jatrophihabitans sp.]